MFESLILIEEIRMAGLVRNYGVTKKNPKTTTLSGKTYRPHVHPSHHSSPPVNLGGGSAAESCWRSES